MSGQLEQLQDDVSTLQRALQQLCAKSGHDYEEHHWRRCAVRRHQDDVGLDHKTRCDICGQFKCGAEE